MPIKLRLWLHLLICEIKNILDTSIKSRHMTIKLRSDNQTQNFLNAKNTDENTIYIHDFMILFF